MPLRSSAHSEARCPSRTTAGTVSVARPCPASTRVRKIHACCSATRRVRTCTVRKAPVRKLFNRYCDALQPRWFSAWWLRCSANSLEGSGVNTVVCWCMYFPQERNIYHTSERNSRLCFILEEHQCLVYSNVWRAYMTIEDCLQFPASVGVSSQNITKKELYRI